MAPRRLGLIVTRTAHDGLALRALEVVHGSGAPTLVAVHATGFCKEVLLPMVDELAGFVPGFTAILPDQRAHGDSEAGPHPFDWWDLGRDVLTHLEGARGVIGFGHSSGAAAVVLAELLAPGTFAAMVLVEPITLPGPYRRGDDHPFVERTLRRRNRFSSPDDARANWTDKPLFRSWDERALDAFVAGGLRRDGDGYVLKCDPRDEAEFYAVASLHGAYDRLHEIDVPVTLVAGAESDSHPEPVMARLADRFRNARVVIVGDAGHLVPMERPRDVAFILAEAVSAAVDERAGDQ